MRSKTTTSDVQLAKTPLAQSPFTKTWKLVAVILAAAAAGLHSVGA